MSFLIGNDPSPRSYNDSAHHHCHSHYHHHHHNHLHQQSSSIIIIFYLSWLQQGSSTISCPKLSQGPAAWGLSAKDYAPNILQRLCTKYFFKESAQNILQRLGTKYFAKNQHQIVCNSYNCWEKKIMQQILRPKLYMTIKYFGHFFSNHYAKNYTCWPWNIMLLLLFVNKGGNDVSYIGKGSQKNGYFLWNSPWRRRGLGCH